MIILSTIKKIMDAFGFEIHRKAQWEFIQDDKEFVDLEAHIRKVSVVDMSRLVMLYGLAKHVAHISGDVAECGVYRGGTAYMISKIFFVDRTATVHLFDTFEGMPAVDRRYDLHEEGDFQDTSLAGVKDFLRECKNIQFHQGLFSETLRDVADAKFRFVHVDCDIYPSVKECCEFFYPRMVQGGIILFDDYGFPSCPGAKKATDEFFSDKKEHLICLPTKQAAVIKK